MIADDGLPVGYFPPHDVEAYRNLVRDIKGGLVVEVGCWLGRSICAIWPICSANGTAVVGVDWWRKNPGSNIPPVDFDPFEMFLRNLDACGVTTFSALRETSTDGARFFADNSIDLVFIDADHSEECVTADIKAWWPKVKWGGILAGHDYENGDDPGVKAAVDKAFGSVNKTGSLIWSVRKGPKK